MTQTAGGPTRRGKREGAPLRTTPALSAPSIDCVGMRGRLSALGSMVRAPARALASPGGLVGTLVEVSWLTTHSALYPLGHFGARERRSHHAFRVEHLPPMQRGMVVSDVEAAGTPILLVHGMIDNRSVFTLLRRGLRRRGFGRVTSMNYSPLTGDVRTAAAALAQEVEALVAETGYERVHIIGHSMGGLIARYYITRLGGDERVHTLVTLGTPHQGTYLAYGWPSRLCRQLRPGSALMTELEQPVPQCRTRFVAYWSDLDQVIIPQSNAALVHPDLNARNVVLHGVGHTSLPIIGSVVHGISTTLAHLDSDGTTLAEGVTELRDFSTSRGR